jgi:hypothetical protein
VCSFPRTPVHCGRRVTKPWLRFSCPQQSSEQIAKEGSEEKEGVWWSGVRLVNLKVFC